MQGNHAFYVPSLAYTVGNVVFKTTNMIKHVFGKNIFKHTHIDTRMAFTEFAKNSNKEFIHKNKPTLGIKPVIDILSDDIFLADTYLTTNKFPMSFNEINGGNFNFIPFFRDIKSRISGGYLLNRIRIKFGVMMNFDTIVEQINWFSILTSKWTQMHPIPRKTAIEIQLPRPMLQMISTDSGVPMDPIEKFLDYLNMHCSRPITYQMKNSSGKEEFFLYYPLTIEYIPFDYNMENVERLGQTIHSAPITFTMNAEFNTIQMFDYASCKHIDIDAFDVSIDNSNIMIPIVTMDNIFKERNDEGWRFYTTRMYKVDSNKEDRLDLSSLFKNTSVLEIINYHNLMGINNHIFFNIQVWGIYQQLKEHIDYEFDFKTLTLITKKCNKNITYRFVIYINDEYINDLTVRTNLEVIKK